MRLVWGYVTSLRCASIKVFGTLFRFFVTEAPTFPTPLQMPSSPSIIPGGKTDAQLVGDCLGGDRDAFAEIVRRYQTLVCSLAYSATGDLPRSEDLAQDTFLAVWRQLPELREPEKLRAWVCGIVRNRIQDSIRSRYREPTYQARTLDNADMAPAPEDQPSDQAVEKDEAAIVWRALEQIPEIYREPLILFHRENQSVEKVASLLEISEDAVKQRLVRGRKLLQAEVEAVVEGTLRRTVPGRTFTTSVMGLLPPAAMVGAAKTGAVAATSATLLAKGSIAAGASGWLSTLIQSPFAVIPPILLERKQGLLREAQATSEEERTLAKKQRRIAHAVVVICAIILAVFTPWYKRLSSPPWFAPVFPLVVALLLTSNYVYAIKTRWRIWKIWGKTGTPRAGREWEFRSRLTLLGLPWVHIRLDANTTPVKAWIAVGNVAYGAFFALGTVAAAPFCIGIFAAGLVSAGMLAIGAMAVGGHAVGVFAVGLVAVGWMASGLFAFGLQAAYGFAAYARNFAGSTGAKKALAYALHANDAVARKFFMDSHFFSSVRECARSIFHFRLLPAVLLGGVVVWIILQQRLRFTTKLSRKLDL
jgi:RNA polymerase sigma factor (sigma-70 family)